MLLAVQKGPDLQPGIRWPHVLHQLGKRFQGPDVESARHNRDNELVRYRDRGALTCCVASGHINDDIVVMFLKTHDFVAHRRARELHTGVAGVARGFISQQRKITRGALGVRIDEQDARVSGSPDA